MFVCELGVFKFPLHLMEMHVVNLVNRFRRAIQLTHVGAYIMIKWITLEIVDSTDYVSILVY